MNFFAACARLKGFECEDPLDTAAVIVFIPFPEAVLKGVVHVQRRKDHLYFNFIDIQTPHPHLICEFAYGSFYFHKSDHVIVRYNIRE